MNLEPLTRIELVTFRYGRSTDRTAMQSGAVDQD